MESSQAHHLVDFLHALSPDRVPADVAARGRDCLLDALGCGLFGSQQPWSRILAAEMRDEAAKGKSTVIGLGLPLSAPAAALCNGTAIHGFELDDLIAESITHPAAAVIPAALAAAESEGISGERLLLSIVAGYEAMHRIGAGLGDEPAHKGFHKTSLAGPAAAAVAAGMAMGLNADEFRSAIGISCSAASGIKNFATGHGGGMVKRLHLGRAAEAGVRACQLARRGFSGPPNAVDGGMGLLEVFGGAGARPERLSRGLGQEWALRDIWFKVYPICGWIQSVVQLVLQLRGDGPVRPGQVRSVEVGVSGYAARNNGEKAPVDTMGAQYSIPYCAALALLGDPRDPAGFLAETVADPAIREMASRVEVVVDPEVDAVYPAKFAARVALRFADGTVRQNRVMECHGTPADPCTPEELASKFALLAARQVGPERAGRIAATVKGIADLRSVGQLTSLLGERPS